MRTANAPLASAVGERRWRAPLASAVGERRWRASGTHAHACALHQFDVTVASLSQRILGIPMTSVTAVVVKIERFAVATGALQQVKLM
jgi:hypothetical protein